MPAAKWLTDTQLCMWKTPTILRKQKSGPQRWQI